MGAGTFSSIGAVPMKLIAIPTSSPVRKVRILLEEKAVPYEMEFVDTFAGSTSLQFLNPLGKVPVLILDDGAALFDSHVIVEHLEHNYPRPQFVPQDHNERLMVKRWEALADGAVDAIREIIYECQWREVAFRSNSWIARQRGKLVRALERLSDDLGEREWCVSDRITLADVIIGCVMGSVNARLSVFGLRNQHANLWALRDRLEKRPSFERTRIPEQQIELP
jgi:glutathione S-transferase